MCITRIIYLLVTEASLLLDISVDLYDHAGCIQTFLSHGGLDKSQFSKVMPKFGYDMDSVVSVHQLVSNAIILTGSEDDEDADTGPEEETSDE